MKLQKSLGAKEVFSISAGAMISSGLFILPAIAFGKVGPAVVVAYLLSSIFVVPALFSKAELTTAMPKSGGVYFFTTRSFGALFGTFVGFATWFSLSLKSAFALVGIGVFLAPLLPNISPYMVQLVAVGFTVVFCILNILSVKESGRVQLVLVSILLILLLYFVVGGIGRVNVQHFTPFAPSGIWSIFTVVGVIFVSFGGLTKVASVAEEVNDPGRSIPRGMFSAFAVVTVFYLLVIFVTTGLLSGSEFANTLTPISAAAEKFSGRAGFTVLAIAAMLAFITTGNAGLLAASRNPLAMARDNLLPSIFATVHPKLKTPVLSILITSGFMIACIVLLDLENLVKVASTLKLILFTFVNLSVIMMRQSKVVSYRPVFRSPLYPYLQIGGVVVYILLIIQMGWLPLVICLGFFLLSLFWFLVYSRSRAEGKSAFIQMIQNIANRDLVKKDSSLTEELVDILRDRDEIEEDRFDTVILNAPILDLKKTMNRQEFFDQIAELIGDRWNMDPLEVRAKLQQREDLSSTLIYPGVAVPHAIPHIVLAGSHAFEIVLVRNKYGIVWNDKGEVVYTAFCLVGTKDERNFHLKALMSIAQILQDPDFHKLWQKARNEEDLRSVVLITKRRRH